MQTPPYINPGPKKLNGKRLSFCGWSPAVTYPSGAVHPEHVLVLADGSKPGHEMILSVEGWNTLKGF